LALPRGSRGAGISRRAVTRIVPDIGTSFR
jgi:hypothetical protein